ncbi:hypothetical protein MMPV_001370 [Pyropia vietnamensis]
MTRGRERDLSPHKVLSGRSGASLLNADVTAGRFVSPGQADAPASSMPAAGPSVSFAPSTARGSADDPAGESHRVRGRSRVPSRSAIPRSKSCIRGVSADSEAQTEGSVYFEELSVEDELMQTANGLARPGTGILAADETVAVLGKRFAAVGLDNTPEMRRAYREMLYSTPDLETYTSGIVMYSETVHQSTASDVNFVEMLNARGILVGVKLDRGLHPFGNGEMVTEGLDGLDSRAAAAYAAGIRFAKWRSLLVINFDQGTPSSLAVDENANALAKFAVACQQRRLVPVIEPEVYIAGTHDLEQAATVAEEVLSVVYRALARHGVLLEGTLLQLQMVLPGLDHPEFRTVTPEAIAEATLRTLRRVVPAAVPGVVFLSGGQSEVQATTNLNAINKAAEAATRESGTPVAPWAMSFAFGRVLQASALTLWSNDPTDTSASAKAAKSMVGALLKANCEASRGCYRGPHPSKQSAAIFEALTESHAERVDHELTPRFEASSRAPSRPTSRPPSPPPSRPSSPGSR